MFCGVTTVQGYGKYHHVLFFTASLGSLNVKKECPEQSFILCLHCGSLVTRMILKLLIKLFDKWKDGSQSTLEHRKCAN